MQAEVVPKKLLLAAREAAEALSVSERTLSRITAPRGPLPAIRFANKTTRYAVSDLEEFIASQRVTADDAEPESK